MSQASTSDLVGGYSRAPLNVNRRQDNILQKALKKTGSLIISTETLRVPLGRPRPPTLKEIATLQPLIPFNPLQNKKTSVSVQTAKQSITKPLESKGKLGTYSAAAINLAVPETPLEYGQLFAIGEAAKIAPVLTGAAITASGITSRKQATTPIEKAQANLIIGLGAVGLAGDYASKLGFNFLDKITKESEIKKTGGDVIEVIRPSTGPKTPLSRTFTQDIKLEINKPKIESYVKEQINKNGGNYDSLSNVDKEFIKGQVEARIRNNPQKFIPETSKKALQNIAEQKQQKLNDLIIQRLEASKNTSPIPFIKMDIPEQRIKLSELQKTTLKRLGENVAKDKVESLRKATLDYINNPDRNKVSKLDLVFKKDQADFIREQFKAQKKSKSAVEDLKLGGELRAKSASLKLLEKPVKEKPLYKLIDLKEFNRKASRSLIKTPEEFVLKARTDLAKKFKGTSEAERIKKATRTILKKTPEKTKGREVSLKFREFENKGGTITRQQTVQLLEKPKSLTSKEKTLKLKIEEVKPKKLKSSLPQPLEKDVIQIVGEPVLNEQKIVAGLRKMRRELKTTKPSALKQIFKEEVKPFAKAKPEALRLLDLERVKSKRRVETRQIQIRKSVNEFEQAIEKPRLRQTQKQIEFKDLKLKFEDQVFEKPKVLFRERQSLIPIGKFGSKTKQSLAGMSKEKSNTQVSTKVKQSAKLRFGTPQKTLQIERQIFGSGESQLQRFNQKQKIGFIPRPKTELKRRLLSPSNLRIESTKNTIKQGSLSQGFIPYAKEKFTRKYIKLSDSPLTREAALSRGAEAVDKTVAATFKIVPIKSKQPAASGGNYYSFNKQKFRESQIRKGREFKTPNTFIEKSKFRIDSTGEKKDLSVAKYAAQRGWLKARRK